MRYEILEKLGTGGMSRVYRAHDTQLDREVALKVLRGDDPNLHSRLLREARAQAKVAHPHICEVYEVGQLDDEPFIAMRWIDGETLRNAAPDMTLEEKVEVLLAVAEAVQTAHRHGLIHRDLKPSNVMVEQQDGRWYPYVLDFGLARELDAPGLATVETLQGTPGYMAPEQVVGGAAALDHRADIYSLGAMLYEILSGRPPFSGDTPVAVMFDALNKDAPPLRRWDPALPADLELITGKCLEREPEQRYSSARLLAEDLERFLAGAPVLARPPSLTYRLRRAMRRHRAVAAVSALSLLALLTVSIGGGIKYTLDLRHERAQAVAARLEAESAEAKAEEVARFLVDIFQVSDPAKSRGGTITASEILERGAERIRGELAGQPRTRARLQHTIGTVYSQLGLSERAAGLLEEAVETRRQHLGAEHPSLAESLEKLAMVRRQQARYDDAEALLREALAILESAPEAGDQRASVLGNLALVLLDLGQVEDAAELYRQALDDVSDPRSAQAGTLWRRLGTVERRQGRFDEAEELFRRALEIHKNALGDDHPEVATDFNSLGISAISRGRFDEAEKYLLQTLEIRQRVLGPNHLQVAAVLSNLGNVYGKPGNTEKALEFYGRSLRIKEEQLGPDHPSIAINLNNLAILHWEANQLDEAAALLGRAVAIREATFGPDSWQVAQFLSNLGELEWTRGRDRDAEKLYLRSLKLKEQALAPDHPSVAYTLVGLANLYRDQERYAKAEPYYQRALEIRKPVLEADHPELLKTYEQYAKLLRATGRDSEAEQLGR